MSADHISSPDIARVMGTGAAGSHLEDAGTQPQAERRAQIFPGEESAAYRTQWDAVQTGFVDEPRKAVEAADALVAQIIKRLSEVFAEERTTLERQWDRGEQISTEDLRVALQKYRSFFERLLSL